MKLICIRIRAGRATAPKWEGGKAFDLGELANFLDGLECKILKVLLTTGSVSSKKELALATGATYKMVLSSTKRLQEAELIEIRKEILRGKKGAVIRHSIKIASNVEEKQLETLVKQGLEKLEKCGDHRRLSQKFFHGHEYMVFSTHA
ncbi:MAG: hypothetical protein ACUVTL_03440 [Thermoproteota archaeon]